jgi:AraC-like DNA-binding protein
MDVKTVQFKDLNTISFDIHNIILVNHNWRNGESFRTPEGGRPDNGIMFITDCEFVYPSDGAVKASAKRGDIVYSPKFSEYSCRFIVPDNVPKDHTSDYLINFTVFEESSKPDKIGDEIRFSDENLIISPENPNYFRESFKMIDSLGRRGYYPSARIKGLLYNLLYDISLELQKNDIMSRRFAPIYPAIRHIRTTDLAKIEVSQLAELCHLSSSCFRRLFGEYAGMSPLEYINRLKVSQARLKLQSGVMNVAEVAESLGFSDASYFSRFYKKATGCCPSDEIKKMFRAHDIDI